jgi:2-oxoisovalerate dehydrogenase E1 component
MPATDEVSQPIESAEPQIIPDADALERHSRMVRIRLFEEAASTLYRDGAIPGFLHTSMGQEATAVGGCWPLRPTDGIVSTHRGHGHCLAKGMSPEGMFAELMGRASGSCGGYGGSMHIADLSLGVFGANGIVGAGLPIANGVAQAFRLRASGDVVVAFFGDGAVATGAFHEAINLAALWRLPVLFLCENNHFAEFTSSEAQHLVPVHERARGYGIEGEAVDGNDVHAVALAAGRLVARLRAGEGPFLLESVTYRWRGHYEGDPAKYRDESDRQAWEAQDPIVRSASLLDQQGLREAREQVEESVRQELEQALSAAQRVPEPDPPPRSAVVVSPGPSQVEAPNVEGADVFRTMDAVRDAMAYEMERSDDVWLAGIDVGAGGNIYGVTRGLWQRFPDRVLDTPIAESAIIGLAVGGAMAGTRPIVEIMYMDFIGICLDQIMNQAAKLPYMTGGQATMPLVIRTQTGAGRSSAAQHSQSLEAILAHIPGLVVVMPSTPADFYGLLRAAIVDSNPVVFVEHRYLYGKKGPRPPADYIVPLGKAAIRRSGEQVTVLSWSKVVDHCLDAAEIAHKDGVSAEVIDARTITPLDEETIFSSVEKTGRLLVVHEAVQRGGFGAEVVAQVAERLFWSLDTPIRRLAAPFVPVPYAPSLERGYVPEAETIAQSIVALARE